MAHAHAPARQLLRCRLDTQHRWPPPVHAQRRECDGRHVTSRGQVLSSTWVKREHPSPACVFRRKEPGAHRLRKEIRRHQARAKSSGCREPRPRRVSRPRANRRVSPMMWTSMLHSNEHERIGTAVHQELRDWHAKAKLEPQGVRWRREHHAARRSLFAVIRARTVANLRRIGSGHLR